MKATELSCASVCYVAQGSFKILKYDRSNEDSSAALSSHCHGLHITLKIGSKIWVHGFVTREHSYKTTEQYFSLAYYTVKRGSNFWVCVYIIQMKDVGKQHFPFALCVSSMFFFSKETTFGELVQFQTFPILGMRELK